MRLRSLLPTLLCGPLLGLPLLLPHLQAAPPARAPLPRLPREGELAYEVRDADTGATMPAKLSFVGVDGSPDPAFTRNDIGRQDSDEVLAYSKLMTLTGLGAARVPYGTYDIYISRGPEWELFIARKVRIGDQPAQVRAALRHVVPTPGWLSADFHVHAACSPDSQVPMLDRVYEFAADGVDLIASTDHNVVCDYAPIIAELGAGRHIASLAGDEITTATWGHFGAFPLPQDLQGAGHGAVLVRGKTAADFFRDVRQRAPDAVIDVHHPRIDREIGYFNLGQLDVEGDRAGRAGFSYDFDAVEVLNGYQDSERLSVDRVIHDWFTLLNHGHLVTATGNSDTHHLTYNIGGYPRNYVLVQDDRPSAVRPVEVARALKAHRSFFTTGPFVKLRVGGGQLGDLVMVPRDRGVVAEIEVLAAPWVSVSRVTLYLGGREIRRWAVVPGSEVQRFHERLEVRPERDSYVVVRVDGDRPLWPVVGDRTRFDVRPLALTNPVFLDVNRNGVYDAPSKHGKH